MIIKICPTCFLLHTTQTEKCRDCGTELDNATQFDTNNQHEEESK